MLALEDPFRGQGVFVRAGLIVRRLALVVSRLVAEAAQDQLVVVIVVELEPTVAEQLEQACLLELEERVALLVEDLGRGPGLRLRQPPGFLPTPRPGPPPPPPGRVPAEVSRMTI